LDLGSAPGGWSQFIIKKYSNSRVFAVDILDMKKIDGVDFFQTSIEEIQEIHEIEILRGKFNLVISDIAPNLTGINAIDIENIYQLNCLTLDTAVEYLEKSSGSFIMKTFQNSMLKNLRKKMELSFKIVQTFKPAASKKQSGEIYLYGAYK
jgi:23S rRNA (uridine2552-2'-O)-methyltransferase